MINIKNNIEAFANLELGIHAALKTYSNVHRGSGHNSMVTTHLYEQAREIILEYLGLNKGKYTVIFCSPRIENIIKSKLEPKSYQSISCKDIGLNLGVRALTVKKSSLPKGAPFLSGGGTTKLISKEWVIWADAPDRFEAGTPAIINVIAFAKAIYMIKKYGKDIFLNPSTERLTAIEILHHDELEKYTGQELLNELRKTLIGRNLLVPTMKGTSPFINMDNSASTPTFSPIWNAFRQSYCQTEQVKKDIINEVKSICADFLGAPLASYDVIFTSNTTEAINLTAESFGRESELVDTEPIVLNTIMEHSSNDLPWRMIPKYSLIRLLVNDEGFVNLNELETLLIEYNQNAKYGKKRIKLVAISGASNVLGICNNIKDISQIVHKYGARLFVDAAQLVAHRKVEIEKCEIDYLVFSAHKVYAPFGCGVLIYKKGLLNFKSEELELIKLSGEENTGGIAALGKSLVLLKRIGMDLIQKEEQILTEKALNGMSQIAGLKIHGVKNVNSPGFANKIGVIVFELKGNMPNSLAKELALRSGIGIRYGCHCAHIIIKHLLNVGPSLEKFQRLIINLFPKLKLPGLARVSFGIENSKEDVDMLIQVLNKISGKSHSTDKETTFIPKAKVKKQMNEFTKAAANRIYY